MKSTKIIAILIFATLTFGFTVYSVQALTPSSLYITGIEVNKYKNEIIKHINNAKVAKEDDENYSLYSYWKISEIEKFYSLDDFKIDGFGLYSVSLSKGGFSYYYTLIERLQNEKEYSFSTDDGIMIGITGPNGLASSAFEEFVKESERSGRGYMSEDGMLYSEMYADIFVPIGDELLSIYVPNHLNKYEIMRDLCYEIIKTAELVIVDGYSQIPPAESDIATEPIVPPPPTVYENFNNWNGTGDVSARIDTDHTLFENVMLNGNEVASENYRITAGSTIVTLLEPYLRTLPVGTHDFVVNFSNGTSVTLPLTVSTAPTPVSDAPKGGVALLIVPVLIAGLVVVLNIRRIRS